MNDDELSDLHAFDFDAYEPFNDHQATAWATVQHIWEDRA